MIRQRLDAKRCRAFACLPNSIVDTIMARILVIDDDRGIRHLLDSVLRHKGHDVLLAENGSRGLERFRRDDPDIIVLDLKMRGWDGLAVLQHVRKFKQDQRVVIFTGACDPTTEQQLRALVVTEIVDKGSSLHYLEEALKRALTSPDLAAGDRGEKSKDCLDESDPNGILSQRSSSMAGVDPP